ncbi:MAG: HAD family phosphatase [Chloroflexi bacterium]|nr:HAD family phosphatase [Chloroflexota bacterium]
MRYIVVACDYDGTLSYGGVVTQETLAALERLLKSGRKLIIVTGRELPDLLKVFPAATTAEAIVAENGAVIYQPRAGKKQVLDGGHHEGFIEALRSRGVTPLSVGEVIVSSWHPNENIVLDTIRALGLELQVAFNKGAIMVLPSGINKGTGLTTAIGELGLSLHNTLGIGDAENDYSFLRLCECFVAVSNALPELKEEADLVTQAPFGEGVVEVIDELVSSDLVRVEPKLTRHNILLGTGEEGAGVCAKPYQK